jgi:PPOX class probable F420-dependent enzyme
MSPTDVESAIDFVRSNHRAVMVTRRREGGVQTSPVAATVDEHGVVVVSSQTGTAKVRNLRRDPRVTLCVLNNQFFGAWCQIDGRATILELPDAMEPLVEYYRSIAGEHPDWDDYRRAMEAEQRVLIRIDVDSGGPVRNIGST